MQNHTVVTHKKDGVDEVIEHVRRALNSDAARAVVRSLIAKGDEARPG